MYKTTETFAASISASPQTLNQLVAFRQLDSGPVLLTWGEVFPFTLVPGSWI